MILSPRLRLNIRPTVYYWMKQTRNIRPTIKIGKEKFQITIDVHQFNKNEIRVKAKSEYVVIEGKHETNTKRGYIMRHFIRKFKLPEGCSPDNMESKLSPEGILTITATRRVCDSGLPCETLVPISYSGPEKPKQEESLIPVNEKEDICSKFKTDSKKDEKLPDGK